MENTKIWSIVSPERHFEHGLSTVQTPLGRRFTHAKRNADFSCFLSANQRFQRPDSKMYGSENTDL
jgi:hypothetical protein